MHDSYRNKNLSVFLCNHMVSVLAQRGGSCSIVLTENMFSSSYIMQPVSAALFFSLTLLLVQVQEHVFAFNRLHLFLSAFVSWILLLLLNNNTVTVRSPPRVKQVGMSKSAQNHAQTPLIKLIRIIL